jgi:iron-sulfur cluster assembly protein
MVTLTDRAIEEIKRITLEQNTELDKIYLRLRVVGGGCSGFQTKLDLDENADETKDVLEEVDGVKIAVDKRSAIYLEGVKVDFLDDLNNRGFLVDVPGSKGKCGCGSSFQF